MMQLDNDILINDLVQVKGADGANAAPTRPNTRDTVWDADENYFYMRRTNSAGQITMLHRYRYEPDPLPTPEDIFVTKTDFNSLKGELSDVKQSIQELLSAVRQSNAAAQVPAGNTNAFNGQANGAGKQAKKPGISGATNQQQS